MLKYMLDNLDGLNDALKALYKEVDGKFILQVDGLDDQGTLKRAKDHEKRRADKAEADLAAVRTELEEKTVEIDGMLKGSIPKGDVERLEKSWKEKFEKREKELTEQNSGLTSSMETLLVDNVAQQVAGKISTAPDLIMPHIKGRLKAEIVDGKPVTRVLDADGKPSALTIDELQKEFVASDKFSAIIIGSKASGGGANGGQGGGGSPSNLDYAKATPKEIADHISKQNQT
jgi:hypothetical protein